MMENPVTKKADPIVKKARPVIALMVAITLCGLAVGQAIGEAPGLPDWYIGAFLVGGMVDVMGWQVSREVAKRKGEL